MAGRQAVVLVNLGTPDAPDTKSVRRYLRQFLSDPRVVEAPRPVWFFVLRLFVLPFRPRRVAKLYRAIWQQDSPMRSITLAQAEGLQQRLGMPVRGAMTYGEPALGKVLDEISEQGVDELLLLPLYPQYSGSTTGAVADALAHWMRGRRELPSLHMLRDYWENEAWQEAVARSIREHQASHGRPDRLLFSFHGIPLSYQEKGDRYGARCLETANRIAARLGLRYPEWGAAFQSRFGSRPWLQPYTDETLRQWASTGARHVQVVCPGFAADCLETLEEIAVENRHLFLAAGGRRYEYIPALNTRPDHLTALEKICQEALPG